MTKEQAMQYNKKYCVVENYAGDGMEGYIFVSNDGYVCVDYGYGMILSAVTKIEEVTPEKPR